VLLPLSLLLAVFLMGQGVIQNFSPYKDVQLLEAVTYSQPKRRRRPALLDAQGQPVTETLTTRTQTSPWVRWPRRKPSRCWAPMAAASSMPTRPTR
jgi:hypothetical protein